MSEERKINGINEFLQMSMTNNMPLSVNEKRQIFDLIINLQTQLQQKENIIKEAIKYNEELLKINFYGGMERSNAETNLLILKDMLDKKVN